MTFREFFGIRRKEEDSPTEIVNAYVNLLAQEGFGIVADEKLLPYPKEMIRKALWAEIRGYEALRRVGEDAFRSCGYDKDLSDLKSFVVRLDDFKAIDVADREAIEVMNQCIAKQTVPPEWVIPIYLKYTESDNL